MCNNKKVLGTNPFTWTSNDAPNSKAKDSKAKDSKSTNSGTNTNSETKEPNKSIESQQDQLMLIYDAIPMFTSTNHFLNRKPMERNGQGVLVKGISTVTPVEMWGTEAIQNGYNISKQITFDEKTGMCSKAKESVHRVMEAL